MLSHALRAKVQNGTLPTPTDPNFKQVSLLLHGDGTNGAQNNTFLDSSTNNFTVTRNGNTTQGSFSPFSNAAGAWSNYFDGTGDSLSVPNAGTSLSQNNFTIEAWVYLEAQQDQLIAGSYNSGFQSGFEFVILSNGTVRFQGRTNLVNAISITTSNTIPLGKFTHVAAVKNGSNFAVYIDGVSSATGTGTSWTDPTDFWIGRVVLSGFWDLKGYISNFRLVKGTAVYTSNFTVPTAPLTAITNTSLLTCQSNRFVDNSANNFTITRNGDVQVRPFGPFNPTSAYSTTTVGGSAYFDGTGDYLSVASNAAFAFGTNDYTIECWVYPQNTTSDFFNGGSDLCNFGYLSGQFFFYTGVVNNFGTLVLNQWNHIAASRVSGTLNCYLNGVRGFTSSNTTNFSNQTIRIGINNNGNSNPFMGFLSNARILNGTGLYSGTTITVPTAPLTAITNTQLLLNGTNAGIFDNAGKIDIETLDNARVSTAVTKFGTGSIYFDGVMDYLTFPPTPQVTFGTGDFTIECWINAPATQTAYAGIYCARTGGLCIIQFGGSGNGVEVWFGGQVASSSANLVANGWHHIAFVRLNGVCKIYVDGVAGSVSSTDNTNITTTSALIGVDGYNFPSRIFKGYMDDLRVTKGVARYTANFTPPTAPFPNQ